MSNEQTITNEETLNTEGQTTEDNKSELSNNEVKNHPLFKKLTSEFSALKAQFKEITDSKQAEIEAARLKEIEEKGTALEQLKLKQKEIDDLKASYQKDLLHKDIRTELIKAGIKNETFIKGVLSDYSSDIEVSEYVKAIIDNEENKIFFGTQKQIEKREAPIPVPVGSTNSKTWDQVKKMQTSEKIEDRAEAAKLIKEYMKTHNGDMPF